MCSALGPDKRSSPFFCHTARHHAPRYRNRSNPCAGLLFFVILAPTAAKAGRMTIYDSSNRQTDQSERREDRVDHYDSGDRSLSPNERSNGGVNSHNSSNRRTGTRNR